MKKPSVLIISGWAHGAEAMHPLADAMSGSHWVSSLSLADPGGVRGGIQGKGEDQRGPRDGAASISPYARAIALHLDKAGEPACIVGWSIGGIAAIEAAASYPEKVCGLVLLSATARFCSDTGYSAGVDPAVLNAMIRRLRKSPDAVIADFLLQALYPMRIPADELARRTTNALKQGTNCLIDGLEYLARVDLRDALPAITTPCLIIHGRQDRIVPRQAAQFLVSKLPVSDVELLPSAGHSLIEQCGKDLIYRILQFRELLK
jgi:pimeloyl-[acyl-carrier protein] methyl ester esterase